MRGDACAGKAVAEAAGGATMEGVDDAVAVDEDAGGPDTADAGAVDDGDGGASAAGVGRPLLAAKKVSARRPSASRTAVRSSSECIENEDNRV